MHRKSIQAFALLSAACVGILAASAILADDDASPIFGVKIPADYRDWQLISVAHEAGSLNDIRAILGNDIAINAYREGRRPFRQCHDHRETCLAVCSVGRK